MINASAVSPGKYATGMREILEKALKSKTGDNDPQVDLEVYSGLYSSQPWGSETILVPWQGKLATFSLPTGSPAKRMTLLKYEKDDTFRRIRKNKELAERVIFERDKSGKVIRMLWNNNYRKKLK